MKEKGEGSEGRGVRKDVENQQHTKPCRLKHEGETYKLHVMQREL